MSELPLTPKGQLRELLAAMSEWDRSRFFQAVHTRLNKVGERRTYTLNEVSTIACRLRGRPDETWMFKSFLGGETFSAQSVLLESKADATPMIVMSALSMRSLQAKIAQIKMDFDKCIDVMDGFAEHMLSIVATYEQEVFERIERERKEAQLRAAEEQKERLSFEQSDSWGAF